MTVTTTPLSVDISFSARWWSFISSTRIFVSSFCGHSSGDAEFSDKVALTVHELLENASKYSADPDLPVRCTISIEENRLRATIENSATPSQIALLEKEVSFVNEGDPLATYILKMQESVTLDVSRLGLARIRYEGEAGLALKIRDGVVIMEASFILPEGSAGANE